MPHHADDQRYPHLSLIREEHNPERRRWPAPPSSSPQQGKRKEFAKEIRHQVEELERQASQRPVPPTGIEPHLVFRIPVAKGTLSSSLIDRLAELNISVVAVEADGAIIAFRDDPELAKFKDAIARYQRGPSLNPETGEPRKSTKWDVFEWIDAANMRLWGKSDRIGGRLAAKIGTDGGTIETGTLYVLDIEIWYPANRTEANALLQEVRTLIDDDRADGERLCDSFVGELLCLARVHVRGSKLARLLELDCIAEVDVPLQPVFNAYAASTATPRDFPTPPRPPIDGPRVCVVDSGIASNHPLLASNVGHAEAILTDTETPADENGHGTMVAGLAVFGDVRASYNAGRFASDVTLFSARVLNKDNRFDDDELILTQMRKAIETFKAPPHNCRVFNISLGEDKPLLTGTNSKQGMWAEALDTLAREHQVLFVVSAGNHTRACAHNPRDAELVLQSYPRFLMEPECGLCDPATAAIAITVGGIAANDDPAFRLGSGRDDITLPVATALGPTPCTRIGPGINDSMKPEFVADAGNDVFAGMGNANRRITDDNGIAVMSLSHVPLNRLFSFDVGSSFAAPQVARIAAKVWSGLEQEFDEVHPNFVRAVLGTASVIPACADDVFQGAGDEETIRREYGYGMIDEDFALATGDRRVTLVA